MRILPALPATPPPALGSGIAGTGSPTLGRVVDARIVTPLAGDLYQAVAGQLQLQVRSTVPLIAGQPVRLHLHGQGQASVVPDQTDAAILPDTADTPAVLTQLSARGQLLASAALNLAQTTSALQNPALSQTAARATPATAAGNAAAPAMNATDAGTARAGSAQAAPTTLAAGGNSAASMPAPASAQAPATRLYQELSGRVPASASEPRAGAHAAQVLASAPAEARAVRAALPGSETRASSAVPAAGTAMPASVNRGLTDIASQARVQLQSLLPRQQDPTRLVALLQALTPALQDSRHTASPLLQAARQLLNSLPTSSQMQTSAGVLGSLQRSGLLAPDRDTPGTGHVPHDLKQALAALAEIAPALPVDAHGQRSAPAGQLHPLSTPTLAPPADEAGLQNLLMQLAAEAEPVLARIESHQLMHLQQQDSTQPQWLFELPLRHGQQIDLWQCQIQRDAPRPDQQEQAPGWQLTLSVDMATQGPLMIRLGMQGEQLWIHFHTGSAATQQQIHDHLGDLLGALRDKGVVPAQLTCHQGLPHPDALPDPPHHVLETTA